MNDRERLIELLKVKYDHYCDQCGVNKQTDYIENLADYLISHGVTVQKHGTWLYVDGKGTHAEYECNQCRFHVCFDEKIDGSIPQYKLCPDCGAKMEKGEA